jgi:hypothetical protein
LAIQLSRSWLVVGFEALTEGSLRVNLSTRISVSHFVLSVNPFGETFFRLAGPKTGEPGETNGFKITL